MLSKPTYDPQDKKLVLGGSAPFSDHHTTHHVAISVHSSIYSVCLHPRKTETRNGLFNRNVTFPVFPAHHTLLLRNGAGGATRAIQLVFPDGVVEIGPDAGAIKAGSRGEPPFALCMSASERVGCITDGISRRKNVR